MRGIVAGHNATLRALICAIGVALALARCLVWAQAQPLVLGILEDTPGQFAGQGHYRSVRVVFRREPAAWLAFPDNCPDSACLKTAAAQYPGEVHWTIAFNGRNIGQVTSRAPGPFPFYSAIGQEPLVGDAVPPSVGMPSTDFAGFEFEPVLRPLIAISTPNYHDPENWKSARLAADETTAIRKMFRQRFPLIQNCANENAPAKNWAYRDANMRVQKAYASNRRWMLAEVMLDKWRCDGPSDEAFSAQWFVVMPSMEVRFLGADMWLVDAGDYDNDGRSELVFAISGFNRGGYKLFYNDFKQSATFEYSYH